jgi:ABC-type phosphate transport system permease subunit
VIGTRARDHRGEHRLNYKEATPERQSLLIATGLVLFVVTFLVNFAARGSPAARRGG